MLETIKGGFMKNIGLFLEAIIFSTLVALPFQVNADGGQIVRLTNTNEVLKYELQNAVKLKPISKDLGLYHALPNGKNRSLVKSQSQLGQSTSALYSVPNYKVTLRQSVKPVSSDPLLKEQWNWRLTTTDVGINAEQAWKDFGQWSKDRSYNDIVIAVVDGGFDINHPDLLSNKWYNKGEIAGNNKDDDGNGYVDDINGWDVSSNSGTISIADHGTHVAGIIGARGNNSRGIAGINWKTKIMYVSSGELGDTVSTMSAYAYVLAQKKLWIQSQGKKGANVVAVNSSFGIDGVPCSHPEFKVWNDMIEELGKAGIISVAATSNFEVNVDKNGDIPTSCDSQYQITVTNSNRDGTKATGKEWDTVSNPTFQNVGAGFGTNHIDLAAPGDNILSTAQRTSVDADQYTAQSGTSFSTPHVTGAIGYLHSVASLSFNKRYIKDPAAGALELKEILLRSVTPIPAMEGLTKTGGILNLHEAGLRIRQENLLVSSI
jgi:subtilisin family serine protease